MGRQKSAKENKIKDDRKAEVMETKILRNIGRLILKIPYKECNPHFLREKKITLITQEVREL